MGFPRYSSKQGTAKAGLNYVRTIVEAANCIFHEIHQQNDIGIDAIIEIIQNEFPTGRNAAVQIKSGESFYNSRNNDCRIPIDNHRLYWQKYPLPVFGIVYVPSHKKAFWVNIKSYLEQKKEATSINFKCTKINTFDAKNFKRLFSQVISEDSPLSFSFNTDDFPIEEALDLFHSDNNDESLLGLILLFRLYTDRTAVWDEFMDYFRTNQANNIQRVFAYFLAHIPWHMDIVGGFDRITKETKEYGNKLISAFDKADLIKLLALIDEKGISRGTIGQSVEAIISSIPKSNEYLNEIIEEVELPLSTKEWAAIIYAYKNQRTALGLQSSMALLKKIADRSEYAKLILSNLKKFQGFALY